MSLPATARMPGAVRVAGPLGQSRGSAHRRTTRTEIASRVSVGTTWPQAGAFAHALRWFYLVVNGCFRCVPRLRYPDTRCNTVAGWTGDHHRTGSPMERE